MKLKIKYVFVGQLFFLLCVGIRAEAQTSSVELQAAYLFNFAKYIKWPTDPERFFIGVFSDDATMESLLTTLKEKKVGGKEVLLKRLSKLEEALECQIVYLSESNSKKLTLLKEAVKGKNILIVTEEDLIKKGASVSFVIEEERLRFKLNKSALQNAGLTPSDGLLKLAMQF